MSVPDAKRLKDLEAENTRLKKLLAEQVFENGAPHEAVAIDVARVAWAHEKEIAQRLIEPGKPNQCVYVESFNGRLRVDCLNEHWFPTLLHARSSIERLRRDYNEERPKVSATMADAKSSSSSSHPFGGDQSTALERKADLRGGRFRARIDRAPCQRRSRGLGKTRASHRCRRVNIIYIMRNHGWIESALSSPPHGNGWASGSALACALSPRPSSPATNAWMEDPESSAGRGKCCACKLRPPVI